MASGLAGSWLEVTLSRLFPKWTNVLPTVFAVGALGGLCAVVGGFWYYATPKFFKVGYMPKQPGPVGFPHNTHAGLLGMDCRYCHSHVEESAEANVPTVSVCYGCHSEGKLAKLGTSQVHKERTEFIRTAYAQNAPIEWRRVHKLPDYVRNFPHQAHVQAGVSCYSCHGQITGMPTVYQAEPMSMGWCLECHRNPEAALVDPSKVTQLVWVEQTLKARAEGTDPTSAQMGEKVLQSLQNAPPQNCGACHY